MKHLSLLLASGMLFLHTSCTSSGNTNQRPDTDSARKDTTLSVETLPPNSTYKPAFAGQTRIKPVKTQAAWEGKEISGDLKRPWGITALPDGRLLITEKEGALRIATPEGKLSEPITGAPAVDSKGQGGLLGITTDPTFAQNRLLYWAFTLKEGNGNLTAVAKGKLSADDKRIENAVVIYKAGPAYDGDKHYGGRVVFDRAGNLLVSTGERSDLETRPQAQYLNSGLGKVIRITTDGRPASGNPFIGTAAARPEIYSYGHRNVQSLAIHPVTGDLWESEMGPKGGDEVNLIRQGKNYGWPTITYGLEYSGEKVGKGITQQAGLEQPVYYWDPVVSTSGMTFYSNGPIAEWNNNLFISAMSGQHLVRLVIENNKVAGEERLLADKKQRFRDVTQGKDGALYAVTDGGKLYRIGVN